MSEGDNRSGFLLGKAVA